MNDLFGKTKIFEKEQDKYTNEAKEYLLNPQKTEGLLNKALKMANEKKEV